MEENKRGQWGSSFGFLMAAIGSAVGLGNLWGFPYKMGKNGGFAFLIVYLILVVLVGIVVMLGELTLGRMTGKSTVGAYTSFAKKHAWVGYMGVISGFLISSFYCMLGGMVLRYCVGFLVNLFGRDGFAGQGSGFFSWLLYSGNTMMISFAVFMVLTMFIVMGGIKGGIERFTKIAMPALAVILVVLIAFIAIQPGAKEGYAFMFKPNFEVFSDPDVGFFGVLKTAAGQMFFSLSLGMGITITYGSYLSKKENLQRNAIIVPTADTIIALMSGMMIMPACAAFGVDYGGGPGLLFASMQKVFVNGMGGTAGNIMGFLFYLLVFIAAITSSIALMEVCSAFIIDKRLDAGKSPNRKQVTLVFAILIFLIGIPTALDALGSGSATIKAPFELMGLTPESASYAGWNDCWLDLYDMISEGILMPLGALAMSILVGWVWGPKIIKKECEEGGRVYKAGGYFTFCFKFIVPVVMVIVLIAQLQSFFNL